MSSKTIFLITTFVLLLVISSFFIWYIPNKVPVDHVVTVDEQVDTTIGIMRIGNDKESANQLIIDILDNPQDYSEDEVWTARSRAISLYEESGKHEDLVFAFDNQKKNFLDIGLSRQNRADAGYTLITSYCGYARDEESVREIFKGEPFERFWIEGEPRESTQRALEWLHNEYLATPRGAMTLAHREAGRLMTEPELTEEEKAQIIYDSKQYLAEADQLTEDYLQGVRGYADTRRYAGVLYWRAITVTLYELEGDVDYVGAGDLAYEKFFEVVSNQEADSSEQYAIFAYVMRAYFAHAKGDSIEVIENYLTQATELSLSDGLGLQNQLREFIRDSVGQDSGGPVLTAIRTMAEVSPSFADYVTSAETEIAANI